MDQYSKLRELMVSEVFQDSFVGYPYALLLDEIEIDRDFVFLDPVLEYSVIQCGENPLNDFSPNSNEGYADLNYWFHYQFFGCPQNTCHSKALVTRFWRLKSTILQVVDSSILQLYLSNELAVPDPNSVIDGWLKTIDRIICACDGRVLSCWTSCRDIASSESHNNYLRDVIARIDPMAYQRLCHLCSNFLEWDRLQKAEIKAFRRAEADLNKRRKQTMKDAQRNR